MRIYNVGNVAKFLIQNPSSEDWAHHYAVPDGSLSRFPDVIDPKLTCMIMQ